MSLKKKYSVSRIHRIKKGQYHDLKKEIETHEIILSELQEKYNCVSVFSKALSIKNMNENDRNMIFNVLKNRIKKYNSVIKNIKFLVDKSSYSANIPSFKLLEFPINDKSKIKMMSEYQILIDKAKFIEKNLVIQDLYNIINQKMLEIYEIETQMDFFRKYGKLYESHLDIEIERNSRSISHLKEEILQEKSRIMFLESIDTDEHEAATMIQKHWRGYSFRNSYQNNQKQ